MHKMGKIEHLLLLFWKRDTSIIPDYEQIVNVKIMENEIPIIRKRIVKKLRDRFSNSSQYGII